jgi:hypothetical protein
MTQTFAQVYPMMLGMTTREIAITLAPFAILLIPIFIGFVVDHIIEVRERADGKG